MLLATYGGVTGSETRRILARNWYVHLPYIVTAPVEYAKVAVKAMKTNVMSDKVKEKKVRVYRFSGPRFFT